MGYITRNANVILLFLILLSATALVSATIYFQSTIREYNVKLDQMHNLSIQIDQYKGVLNVTQAELELKGTREQELTSKYTGMKGENDALLKDKVTLSDDNKKLTQQILDQTAQIANLTNSLSVTQALVDNLNANVNTLKAKVSRLEDDKTALQQTVTCFRSGQGGC